MSGTSSEGHPLAKGKLRHPLHLSPGRFTRPGAAPGILARPAGLEHLPATLCLLDYDATDITERADCSLDEARAFFDSPRNTWLHVQGTPNESMLQSVADAYQLHPLALEDVLHTGQRAKAEVYDGQIFVIASVPEARNDQIEIAQLSVFLGDTWVVSFCSGDRDPFEAIRKRTQQKDSRIRRNGVDFLFYALLDTAVDHVFPTLESLGERIEALELTVFDDPSREALNEIHLLKRELLLVRRALWPQRDMLNGLIRDEHKQIGGNARLFLRDCYDHSVHALDLVESYREMASSLLEIYLTSLSNRMNDIMKVLTVIATVFIPLSFVTGLYGMNFDRAVSPWNMPELGMRFGYPVLLLFIITVVVGMLIYFRRRRWF
ncbi:MAG: magnesium/cobalt transporter CorA [Gammaproteobacteria bacterium]|nr:magnesium/cobalt transporter CorA [Gammaproteobacteria bacterium]